MPVVIGIAGGSGSGKTTVQRRIIEAFGRDQIALLDHDSYYVDLSHLPAEERARFARTPMPSRLGPTRPSPPWEMLLGGLWGVPLQPTSSPGTPVTHSRYKIIFDRSPDGILLVDAGGVIRQANARARELFGYPEGFEGVRVEAFRDGEDDEALMAALERSYVDTLDCPELCGLREKRDVLDSHRSTGKFDPNLWWLVRLGGAEALTEALEANRVS